MAITSVKRAALLVGVLALMGACDKVTMPSFLQGKGGGGKSAPASTRTVERDVEAPEIFQKSESGLWDGRPTLGGVWVAHPDVGDPERVLIRNEANGKFVIGALFRRERSVPGPAFQVSSDAAEAIGMLAGAPAELSVTALRREAVAEPGSEEPALPPADDVETASLDPIAAATAALDEAEGVSAASPAPTPAPAGAPASGGLSKPFIQIGIFSVEKNARNTAESMRRAGMVPTVKQGKSRGKAFWRVIVGPATSVSERAALLRKIKDLGFSDAYFVSN